MKQVLLENAKVKAARLREVAKTVGDKYVAALEAYEIAKAAYKAAQKESDAAFDAADQAEMVVAILTKAVCDVGAKETMLCGSVNDPTNWNCDGKK